MRFLWLLAMACLLGCVSTGDRRGDAFPKQEVDFHFSWVDSPIDQEIIISVEGLSTTALCIDPGFWPKRAGQQFEISGDLYVLISERKYTAKGGVAEYCAGCELRVKKGEFIRGVIKYNEFEIRKDDLLMDKTLVFDVPITFCN
jgi:hypothetical protein